MVKQAIQSLYRRSSFLPIPTTMRRTYLLILVSLAASGAAFAQGSQRFFDNFDTARGVQVYRPAPPLVEQRLPNRSTRDKKGAKIAAAPGPKLVDTRMRVTEGLGPQDLVRTTASTRMVMGSNAGLKGFTTGDPVVDGYIVDSSRRYNIDPLLIYAQMHQESTFKPRAVSNKGASGLMQLMPGTARRMGVTNIFDPKQNIEGGIKYMRLLLDMFNGDVHLALAGYNAGEGAVMRYGNQIPPFNETREYVRRITARYSSISNPMMASGVRRVTSTEAARLERKDTRPLTVYEPSTLTIRLADGRMRLVNQ